MNSFWPSATCHEGILSRSISPASPISYMDWSVSPAVRTQDCPYLTCWHDQFLPPPVAHYRKTQSRSVAMLSLCLIPVLWGSYSCSKGWVLRGEDVLLYSKRGKLGICCCRCSPHAWVALRPPVGVSLGCFSSIYYYGMCCFSVFMSLGNAF